MSHRKSRRAPRGGSFRFRPMRKLVPAPPKRARTPTAPPPPLLSQGERVGWMLGMAGLVPFLLPAAVLWAGPQRFGSYWSFAPISLLAYAATIISFLGGVRWGCEIARPAGGRPVVIALSTLPQVLAWLAIVFPLPGTLAPIRYGALLFLVLGTGAADMLGGDSLPPWYRRLRIPLTVGAAVSMASGFGWSLMVADSLAHRPAA